MATNDAFLAAVTRWQVEHEAQLNAAARIAQTTAFVDGWNAAMCAQLDVLAEWKRQIDALLVVREGTAPEPRAAASGEGA